MKEKIKTNPFQTQTSIIISSKTAKNSCAYLSSLNLLQDSRILELISVEPDEHNKAILNNIKRLNPESLTLIIEEMNNYALQQKIPLNPIGEHEDAWIICNLIIEMLTGKNNIGINGNPIRPIIECSCGLPQRTKVSTFPEYKRMVHEEKFSAANIFC